MERMLLHLKSVKAFVFAIISILLLQVVTMPTVVDAASKMPKGTTIANVAVSGQTDEEIKATLETEIALWQSGEDFILRSDFENFRVPKTVIEFNLDETIKVLHSKTKRQLSTFFLKPKNVSVPLVAMVNKADETYQTLSAIDYIELDDSLTHLVDISTTLGSGEAPLAYVPGKEMQLEMVAEVELPIEELSDAVLKQLIGELDDFTIEPKSPFIFSEIIQIHDNLKKSPEELSFIASALYTAFLQTDFTIVERHSQLTVPAYTKSGTDAFVNFKLEKDLILLNESEFSYKLSMEQKKDKLYTKLETFPDDFTYKFKRENKKKIKPRTLYRYDLTLRSGQQKEVEKGKNGEAIELHRETYDAGDLVTSEILSIDVYLPQSKIVAVSTDEKISKDGEQLMGNEGITENKPPEDLVVDNGSKLPNVPSLPSKPKAPNLPSKPNINSGPSSSGGHVFYTKEEAEKLLAEYAAEGDRLNKELLEGMDEKVEEMEEEFKKELKRLEKEREKLIAALEEIVAEQEETEEEEESFDDFLTAFEETLAEFPELAEDEEFIAFIAQMRLATELEEEAAEEFIIVATMFSELFEEEKNLDFLLAFLSHYEGEQEELVSSLKVNVPLIASKKVTNNTLDFEKIVDLEEKEAAISKDIKALKKEIKVAADKDEEETLKKLRIQKEVELTDIETDLEAEIVTVYTRILNNQSAVNQELTNTLNTLSQIQDAYEDAKDSLEVVKADREEIPSLKEKDYNKLIKRLIKFSKTDKQDDRKAYDRRVKRINKTLLEIFSNFNNDSGNYLLESMELQASLSSNDVTFGTSSGLQYYPYFSSDNRLEAGSSGLSEYQIISRDILSQVYQNSR